MSSWLPYLLNFAFGLPGRSQAATLLPPDPAYNAAVYVERGHDRVASLTVEQLAWETLAVDSYKPAVFFGPRLCGKTWAMQRLLARYAAETPNSCIIYIDLGAFDANLFADLDTFAQSLAERIAYALQTVLPDAPSALNSEINGLSGLTEFMGMQILPRLPGSLLLALDRADAVVGSPLQDDLFGMWRSWISAGADTDFSHWRRLQMLFAVASNPNDLIGAHGSPFNISENIRLANFSLVEVETLTRKYGLQASEQDIAALMADLRGHPFLTNAVCWQAVQTQRPLPHILHLAKQPDGLCYRFVEMQLRVLAEQPRLLYTLNQYMRAPDTPLDDNTMYALYLAGFCKFTTQKTFEFALPFQPQVLPSFEHLLQGQM